jgi:hypothetical protein
VRNGHGMLAQSTVGAAWPTRAQRSSQRCVRANVARERRGCTPVLESVRGGDMSQPATAHRWPNDGKVFMGSLAGTPRTDRARRCGQQGTRVARRWGADLTGA